MLYAWSSMAVLPAWASPCSINWTVTRQGLLWVSVQSRVKGVDEMNRTVRDIVNDGGSITDVSVEESDLEEIFFGLVGIEDY